MNCPECNIDLGTQETVIAIQGTILCNACAQVQYSAYMLQTYGEEVIPQDIGIDAPPPYITGGSFDHLVTYIMMDCGCTKETATDTAYSVMDQIDELIKSKLMEDEDNENSDES